VRTAIERRISVLEQRKDNVGRKVHFIEAIDSADSDRQIAELEAAGKVSPRDGFLCLTGSIDHERVQPRSAGLSAGLRANS
jgi:hypothetical protein